MSEQRLVVWTEAGHPLDVRRFSVSEAMSRPFEVLLVLRSPDVAIELDGVVNRPASFRIESGLRHGAEGSRTWTGMCNHFEQLRPEALGSEAQTTYLMKIVPRLWQLSLGSDHRIFRHMSIPEIVADVLGGWGMTAKLRLSRGDDYHQQLEYMVQYGETDLAFVERLLERAGISYCFEHGESSELVLVDEPTQGKVRSGLDWVDAPGEAAERDYCTNVRLAHRVKPGKVALRDYDFHRKADFALLGESPPVAGPEAGYEHYAYAPGAFRVKDTGGDKLADAGGEWAFRHTPAEGKNAAARLLGSLRQGKRRVGFDTNVVGLCPGRVVSMAGHPRDDLDEQPLLVTGMSLDGEPNAEWRLSCEAVFADVPYVPARVTPAPRIAGVQSAIVTGAEGEEIYPDEHGRVKARFAWDRGGKYDEHSSCWMRVSQAWAGSRFGSMFVPRVGHEVLVAYLDGDPDLPVVVGRAYNMTRPVPYNLPEHKQKSVWKTKTSPKSDKEAAYNEWRLDDAKDEELVYVQAQKDYQELVKRSDTERTGKNRVLVVGNHRTSVVAKVDARLVGQKYSVQIVEEPDRGKDEVEDKKELAILQQRKPELTPLGTKLEMVDERVMATSGEATVVLDDKEITFNAEGELSLRAGGTIVILGGPNIKINC